MKLTLFSNIAVRRIAVFAELAWLERRPELGLLCRTALDHERRLTSTTVRAALPGLAEAGAKNVIAWARVLGLCDANGILTQLGEGVASTDEAPVPEQGVYGLWLINHPVTGRRVIAAERLAAAHDQRFDSVKPIAVDVAIGQVFRSVVNNRERFIVRALLNEHGQHGAIEQPTIARCRLRWTLDFDAGRDHWQLEGQIDAPQSKERSAPSMIQHAAESVGLDLWRAMESISASLKSVGDWDSANRRLLVSADELTISEARSFRRSFSVARVDVPGRGAFHDVRLEDVPIAPRTANDAQNWAMARFDDDLAKRSRYQSRSALRARFAELVKDTPLDRADVALPSHDDMLRRARTHRAQYWSLAAAVDLSPTPVDSTELGAMPMGAPR